MTTHPAVSSLTAWGCASRGSLLTVNHQHAGCPYRRQSTWTMLDVRGRSTGNDSSDQTFTRGTSVTTRTDIDTIHGTNTFTHSPVTVISRSDIITTDRERHWTCKVAPRETSGSDLSHSASMTGGGELATNILLSSTKSEVRNVPSHGHRQRA